MERGYNFLNPATSINFDVQIQDTLEHSDNEYSEDEVKEKELQDILTNAFDDLESEDNENESFQGSSLHSSRNSHNSNENRFGHRNGIETDNVITKSQSPNSYIERDKKEESKEFTSIWEGQYYIDQLVESESQYQIQSEFQEKACGDVLHKKQGNVFAFLSHAKDDNTEQLNSYTKSAIETQTEGDDANFIDRNRLRQLEVLYEAKGREMDRLNQDFELFRDNWRTERSILKKQLEETEEEKVEYATSLEECQRALDMANAAGTKLEGELRAMNIKLSSVNDDRLEILSKLQVAESTIEGLHAHVNELQKTDAYSKARENHSAMINTVQERYQSEIHKLNIEIDDLKEKLFERDDQVEHLKEKVDRLNREYEGTKIERSDTVKKLISALEESQERYKNLLIAVKVANEQNISVDQLKEELALVKHELDVYRSASQLGVGIKNVNNPSVAPSVTVPTEVNDNLISSLKTELERSLASLSAKNELLKNMKGELQSSSFQTKKLLDKSKLMEAELNRYQTKVEELSSELKSLKLSNEMTAKELSQVNSAKSECEIELKRTKKQVEEMTSSELELKELIQKLREDLIKMEANHEEDKANAVEVCLDVNSLSVQKDREKAALEIMELKKQYELRTKALIEELTDVKKLYVEMCKESEELRESLQKEFDVEKQKLLKSWTEKKELELEALKLENEKFQLDSNNTQDGNVKNAVIAKEVVNEVARQISGKIKQAKRVWEEEQAVNMEEAVLAKARELFQQYLDEKTPDGSDIAIEEYLEQIKEMEERVKETEELYRLHLQEIEENKSKEITELENKLRKESEETQRKNVQELEVVYKNQIAKEMKALEDKLKKEHETILRDATLALKTKFEQEKQLFKDGLNNGNNENLRQLLLSSEERLKNINSTLEKQRELMQNEYQERIELEKNKISTKVKLEAEKSMELKLQKLLEEKELEKMKAVAEQEEKLCKELEEFLMEQKQRFLNALQTMQTTHTKEKLEIQKHYDEIISRLKSECKENFESRNIDQQRLREDNLQQYEVDREQLLNQIEQLKKKCFRLEKEKTSLSSDAQFKLKATKIALEECKLKLEQNEADWAASQEELVIAPLRKEVATYMARASASEDVASQLRLQMEVRAVELKTITEKYATLKEKVKKYHRYVHGKEREYADNLVKMSMEHRSALERIANLKGELSEVVESRIGEFYSLVLNKETLGAAYNKRPQTPNKNLNNKALFTERLKDDVIEKDEVQIKKTFLESIDKVHDNVVKFLHDCGQEAVGKIQEEVAKASWVLSEQLRGVSNRLKNDAPATSKQTSSYEGSGTVTPELLNTNGSSGRGTMVGNSAGSASEGASEHLKSTYNYKPLKFWSSTPFQPQVSRFGNESKTPVVTSYLNSETVKHMEDTDALPVSIKPNSRISEEKEEESEEARMAKLRMLTEEILLRSRSNVTPDVTSSQKALYLNFSSDLSTLKNEFWKSINGNG